MRGTLVRPLLGHGAVTPSDMPDINRGECVLRLGCGRLDIASDLKLRQIGRLGYGRGRPTHVFTIIPPPPPPPSHLAVKGGVASRLAISFFCVMCMSRLLTCTYPSIEII